MAQTAPRGLRVLVALRVRQVLRAPLRRARKAYRAKKAKKVYQAKGSRRERHDGVHTTLPSGKTETGTWAFADATKGTPSIVSLSFTIPLELAPEHDHFVTLAEVSGSTAPAECPGSVEQPAARRAASVPTKAP